MSGERRNPCPKRRRNSSEPQWALSDFPGVRGESKKGQTTIPKDVREALGIGPGDSLVYEIKDSEP
ncbi:MAG: AbrB/MazE/SpoVT family DNA-binding domain-containing protein [Planctomycetes bacterium]|nr:AbrB/MazE/SpoVT family DNA-binding domain-containing protein [Planctomycetota bacterium]